MPKEIATNSYTTKCGEVKYIKTDRDNTLKLWYKLHRKKCAVCKDIPYKFLAQQYSTTKSAEGIADHQRRLNEMLEIDIPVDGLLAYVRKANAPVVVLDMK